MPNYFVVHRKRRAHGAKIARARDNGPIFVRKNDQEHILDFGFNAWGYPSGAWGPYRKDDKVPRRIAELLGLGYTQVQYVDYEDANNIKDLIYEGGALEHSGEGTIVGSWAICQDRNPNLTKEQATQIFKDLTGAHSVIWIDSVWSGTTAKKADNHTDGYIRFYDTDKVCVLDSEVNGPGKEAAAKLEQAGWDVYRLPSGFRWTFVNYFARARRFPHIQQTIIKHNRQHRTNRQTDKQTCVHSVLFTQNMNLDASLGLHNR